MPRSKHRRKGVGKSTRHPGRKPLAPVTLTPQEIAWREFRERYAGPFYARWPDDPHCVAGSGYMLDVIADGVFRETGEFGPVSKQSVFEEFLEPIEDEETPSIEDAEAALAFLVEHGFALVDGDQITVPAQYLQSEGGEGPQTVILDPHVAGTE